MADKKIVAASVQVDTDAAVKNMLTLKGTVADLKKEFKESAAGSDEQLAAFKKLQAAEQDLAKAQEQLSGSNEKSAGAFSKIKGGLDQLPGATGAASKGVQGLGAQFKALLANPIVLLIAAIVTVLVALYKAFTSTDEGAQKFQSILDGIGAVIREITQRVASLANGIIKLLSGDFSGAMEEGKKAVTGFGDAMVDSFKRGKEASDLLDEVADAARVLDIQYAAMSARIAKSREILSDETATFKDKTKALKESGEEIDKYYKAKAENDDKELNAIAKKYNIEDKLQELRKKGFEEGAADFDNYLQTLAIGEDGLKQIEDSIKKSIASNEEYSARQRQQNRDETKLQREHAADLKAARDKAAEEEKQRRQELVEFTNKLTKLQQDNELALITDGYQKELKALENRIADEKRQNELSFKDKKITREQLNQLNAALDIQENIQKDSIEDKHQKDVKAKEEAFQKELAGIQTKIKLASIKDSRELERAQLEITYNEQLAQAIEKYKNDQTKFEEEKAKIDELYRIQRQTQEDKFQEEDEKKKYEQSIKRLDRIISDNTAAFEVRKAALDEEVRINEEAYKKKQITEDQYIENKKKNQQAAKEISEAEVNSVLDSANKIGDLLENLSGIIGKQTAIGKAFSVANATIKAIESAVNSFNAMAPIPVVGPYLGTLAAAAALAAGYANVKKILAVQVPGQGNGSAPNLSVSNAPAAPLAPIPQNVNTTIDQNSVNAIGNAAAGGVNAVRAYVVEQDSAEAAARAARLRGASILGG